MIPRTNKHFLFMLSMCEQVCIYSCSVTVMTPSRHSLPSLYCQPRLRLLCAALGSAGESEGAAALCSCAYGESSPSRTDQATESGATRSKDDNSFGSLSLSIIPYLPTT